MSPGRCVFFSLIFIISMSASAAAQETSSVLDDLLVEKIKKVQSMVDDPDVLQAVRAANREHASIGQDDISKLDKQWVQAKPNDEFTNTFIAGFMTNSCANYLKQFQKDNPEYKEIFVTDAVGLNVCQTNKTSDYYQADEDWWQKAYADAKGHAYSGTIEYDESAKSESISVYVPVIDPDSQQTVGVSKAVIEISSLKEEL
jgi:hypothetical protein